ncbi:MAG: class I tRNA ligase family protein [Patescibacteria group bacterium]
MTENNTKKTIPQSEEEIQKFWRDNQIFEKSINQEAPHGDYIFYDGPPFATGTPHYGHIVASLMKDVVPRYWTMNGWRVERKWGWDCHGLPIENIVEKELGTHSKKEIEDKVGVAKFNESCHSKVMLYADEWKKFIPRLGRWVDMEDDYKTMDQRYMESIWWVFKQLWDKGLIYQSYKAMHICPRCETTLSQSEVSEGYKDITDISVTVKFQLVDEPNTYILAWTTTPWTLAGNIALAVGANVPYIKVKFDDGNFYILAKDTAEKTLTNVKHELVEELTGKDLVGKSYIPLFPYYDKPENKERGFKVYAADFVTTTDGTGVVHIAPAFGQDDMNLGMAEKLPFVQHVNMEGRFAPEVTDFSGELVKPIEDPKATDRKIIAWLEKEGKLFAQAEYTHSYPHCWRCDTPLLNYATSSWFVSVTKIKDKMLKAAKKINWVPAYLKEGRFGKWLEGATDWSISRQRFWGSVMPIWQCTKCKENLVFGSIEDLRQAALEQITKLILVRHGESQKNDSGVFDSSLDSTFELTKDGIKQAKAAAKKIAAENKDNNVVIYASPVLRTKQTAEIIAKELSLGINWAPELKEIDNGNWDGKTKDDPNIAASRAAYKKLNLEEQYTAKRGETGESWKEQEDRMYNFVRTVLEKEIGKTIILVGHQGPLLYLLKSIEDLSLEKIYKLFDSPAWNSYAYPMNVYVNQKTQKQFDLHKQTVDPIEIRCPKCDQLAKRIPDVLDCWFESGSMPYAQLHYPFENKEKFESNFPAKFIAEGVDQTRAWFYYLLVISTAIMDEAPFENVIANGIVLAENGQKMSKRLKNYPDPNAVIDRFGADAMRYYLLTSPVVKAETLNFSEQGVEETYKKLIMILSNVFSFYQMYGAVETVAADDSTNILDRWILAKLNLLIEETTKQMNAYDLVAASRPIIEFVDELSTWFVRRSRDRFKGDDATDKQNALQTLKYVLLTLSKIMAPFTPFIAEKIYREIGGQKESVHLDVWPQVNKKLIDQTLLDQMTLARQIVEAGLAARATTGIKIRQPLLSYSTTLTKKLSDELIDILKDELNVLDIKFGEDKLDTTMTPELKEQGLVRELVRFINALRKNAGLTISDRVTVYYQTDNQEINDVFTKFSDQLAKDTLASSLKNEKAEVAENWQSEVKINETKVWLGLK